MAQLNSFVRALIRMALGTALNPGSYPEALEAYLRATQINSRRLIHRQGPPPLGLRVSLSFAPEEDCTTSCCMQCLRHVCLRSSPFWTYPGASPGFHAVKERKVLICSRQGNRAYFAPGLGDGRC